MTGSWCASSTSHIDVTLIGDVFRSSSGRTDVIEGVAGRIRVAESRSFAHRYCLTLKI